MNKLLRSARSFRTGLIAALVLAVSACADDDPTAVLIQDIVDIVTATGDVATLETALTEAGLVAALQGDGPFTVFAPVNSAFDALGADVVASLLDPANAALLTKILTYHVVDGVAALSTDLSDGQTVTTLQGETLTIGVTGGAVTVNGANVTTADLEGENGVVHLIDAVLVPEVDIVEKAILTSATQTLAAAVVAGDLVATLQGPGPFTVFAPNNDAFAALGNYTVEALLDPANQVLLQEILTYHVISGDIRAADLTDGAMVTTVEGRDVTIDLSGATPKVNGADIIATDIVVENGVIHLIDGVLIPELDIVETASITEGTGTLAAAVAAGDLVTTLQSAGPFTVFAPIDDAFDALGEYSLDALLEPANQAILQEILTYHVISGDIRAADLTDGAMVTTVEGRDVTIDLSGATPKVNGADIIATDIVVENGVIHLIDGVLVPELDIVEKAIITEQTATLVAAVDAGGLVATLQGAGPFTVFAPINEAFEALGEYTLDALLDPANQAILADILTYHVISGDIRAADLTDGAMVTTVEGGDVTIDLSGAMPMVNGANIIATDIVVENGVIHLIDAVLTESMDVVQRASVTDVTSTLVAAVDAGGLVGTLQGAGPFTVFAPINEAFEALGTDKLEVLLDPANLALLQKVLTYHVISGDIRAADLTDGAMVTTVEGSDVTIDLSGATPKVNGADIIATDIVVENGVIHLIDGVLTENTDIVDVAVLNGFSTLVDLVGTAGLESTLRSDNGGTGFTVFAPTNEAFAALATVPMGQALVDVLTYHVVGATVGSGDLSDGQMVTTVEGSMFTVNISEGSVTITDGAGNMVNVVLTDVPAANGVIHVIDGVILPS
jgi:uncharacterized surface protein with fasciclin (FAS1) repeats